MIYTSTFRAREIYGIWHIVRSRYLYGILIWRTTRPQQRYANFTQTL